MTDNYITSLDNSVCKILQYLDNAFSKRQNVAYFMKIKYGFVKFCIFSFFQNLKSACKR